MNSTELIDYYSIQNCPKSILPQNIFDKAETVHLTNIQEVEISEHEIPISGPSPGYPMFVVENCTIQNLKKDFIEEKEFGRFHLNHSKIQKLENLVFGVEDDLIIRGNIFEKIEGQPLEKIHVLSPYVDIEITDNIFKNGVFWKFHPTLNNFYQNYSHYVEFSNNFIDGPCDSISYDLKEFIKENKNSLDDSVTGRFVKSLICRAENGTKMELWKTNEFHENWTQWVLFGLATVIIIIFLLGFGYCCMKGSWIEVMERCKLTYSRVGNDLDRPILKNADRDLSYEI